MMADKNNLNYEVRELKLGASFTSNKASQYHTIKYDFKPASVDVNKMASVDVGTNNQVTVTVPHLDGAGVPQTVFKGNQRPYTKECVLIIDRCTGEITLEKLSSNIQVKKTRQETSQKQLPPSALPGELTNTTQRSTSRTRVTTNRRTNPNANNATNAGGGLAAGASTGVVAQSSSQPARGGYTTTAGPALPKAPQSMVRSPQRTKTSPPQAAPWSGGGNSTLASLPMIGLDDALGLGPAAAAAPAAASASASAPALPSHPPATHNGYGAAGPPRQPERHSYAPERSNHAERNERQERERQERLERQERQERQDRSLNPLAPELNHLPQLASNKRGEESSSSSSSDSNSDSDSVSDSEDDTRRQPIPNGTAPNPALPSDVLNDDLCLSESGSDSD